MHEAKNGMIKLKNKHEELMNFVESLADLQQKIAFKKIPFKSINIINTSKNEQILKLGFYNIEKYLISEGKKLNCDIDYKLKIYKQFNQFLLKINKIKTNPQHCLSLLDKLDLSCFKNKEIKHDKFRFGRGGFGEVFKNKYCGIKVIIKFELENRRENDSKKLKYEYYMTKTVNHPNIIKPIGYIIYEYQFGFVMERCLKGSLNALHKDKYNTDTNESSSGILIKSDLSLQSTENLSINEKLYSENLNDVKKIGQALCMMHHRSFVHFDLKPHNIFVSDKNEPKIADFGLSKILLKAEDEKASGCSIYYSPPEQIINNSPNQASDI